MMEQDRKEYLDKDESEEMCSSKIGEAGEMCSPADTDTCGDCVPALQEISGFAESKVRGSVYLPPICHPQKQNTVN